jgi:hypothetical protein
MSVSVEAPCLFARWVAALVPAVSGERARAEEHMVTNLMPRVAGN